MKKQEIIQEYISKLKELKNSEFELVLNEDWYSISEDLKVIYCGDNPGKTEKQEKRYFAGKSGEGLKLFLKINNQKLGIQNIEKEMVFFNKTPYHSNKTKEITKSLDITENVSKSIELTLKCLYELYKKEVKIYVFGVDKSAYINKCFYDFLEGYKGCENYDNFVTVLNHPSHNSLFGRIGKVLFEKFENYDEFTINYQELIDEIQHEK